MHFTHSTLNKIPSYQNLLFHLLEELKNQNNLWVLIPEKIEIEDIEESLDNIFMLHYPQVITRCESLSQEKEEIPVSFLSTILGSIWESPQTPRTLEKFIQLSINQRNFPEILILKDFEKLSTQKQKEWISFFLRWSELGRVTEIDLPFTICILTSANAILHDLPQTDVNLNLVWWLGQSSILETQLLCRLVESEDYGSAASRWREYLIPELVGDDISMIKQVWEIITSDSKTIIKGFQEAAQKRNWTKEIFQKWNVKKLLNELDHLKRFSHDLLQTEQNWMSPASPPPRQYRELWAHGILNWSLEYGFELHAAALLILNREKDFQYRIWRGQAKFLLPLLNSLRMQLCRNILDHHNQAWPPEIVLKLRGEKEIKEIQEVPLSCQWGPLKFFVENSIHLRKEKEKFFSLIKKSWWIRNEIAHIRPINFYNYQELIRKIEQVKDF